MKELSDWFGKISDPLMPIPQQWEILKCCINESNRRVMEDSIRSHLFLHHRTTKGLWKDINLDVQAPANWPIFTMIRVLKDIHRINNKTQYNFKNRLSTNLVTILGNSIAMDTTSASAIAAIVAEIEPIVSNLDYTPEEVYQDIKEWAKSCTVPNDYHCDISTLLPKWKNTIYGERDPISTKKESVNNL